MYKCGLPLHAAQLLRLARSSNGISTLRLLAPPSGNGEDKPLVMGCYGIGVSRLLLLLLSNTMTKEKDIK